MTARFWAPPSRDALIAYLSRVGRGPFGGRVRLGLVAAAEKDAAVLKGPGDLRTIHGARAFLVGAVQRPGPMDMEDFGFALSASSLRHIPRLEPVGWERPSRAPVSSRASAPGGEVMPAVSPVGYAAADRTAVDRVTRAGRGPRTASPGPELFFDGDFGSPLRARTAGPYAEVLEMVRLGPSASNRQPWRLVRDGGGYHLISSGGRALIKPSAPRWQDLQRLDMGIAMCHFELTAREAGLVGKWDRLPTVRISAPFRNGRVI